MDIQTVFYTLWAMKNGENLVTESNILVIHWGRNGGGPRFAKKMAEALASTNEREVFTSLNADAEILRGGEYTNPSRNLPVHTYTSSLGAMIRVPILLLNCIRLRFFIRKHRITIVYSAMSSLWQSLSLRIWLPAEITFLASVHDSSEHPGDEHWLKDLCRRIEMSRANAIVTYSEAVQALVRAYAPTKVPVFYVPHGVDDLNKNYRTLSNRKETITVGFVGRLVEYKGLEVFVDAIAISSSTNPRIAGAIWGAGDVADSLKQRSAHFIDWHIGWIPEHDLENVVDSFDILVLPYLEASQSGAITLGLANGVPVIATPVSGLKEQVLQSGGGTLAKGLSANDVSAAINDLTSNGRLYTQLSKAGLSAAKSRLSWKSAATALSAHITTLGAA